MKSHSQQDFEVIENWERGNEKGNVKFKEMA